MQKEFHEEVSKRASIPVGSFLISFQEIHKNSPNGQHETPGNQILMLSLMH